MRRIRSNLRTFRLALDPSWGTALRAELAWYGRCLGGSRDLHIIRDLVASKGPGVIDPYDVLRIQAVVSTRLDDAMAAIAAHRNGARRFQLTEQMMILWEGPELQARGGAAGRRGPARPCSTGRGASLRGAGAAVPQGGQRGQPPHPAHPAEGPALRLRDGRPHRRRTRPASTARAAERLQIKLGDHLDAGYSIAWFEDLARQQPELAEPLAPPGPGPARRRGRHPQGVEA